MKSLQSLILPFLILFLWLPVSHAQSVLPDNFESWIEDGMQQWDIPGMAIGIVKDGEIVYTRGFGVRKLGESGRVDENTQFGIASVSKHMAASSLGILVDEGKLSWDDPVVKHIPWFRFNDPHATEHVTVRDLLTHQVGVGRMLGNRLQFMTDRSRDELLYRMRYHEFEQPFRSQYVYSNMMYMLAGEVVEAITGKSWDEFMAERFFEPMGMSRSNTSIHDLDESNAAWPHQYIKGETVTIPRRSWDNASAAGGVNSTLTDMTRWMLMQLGTPGEFDGHTYVSARTMRDIQTPQVSQNIGSVTAPLRGYGLGYGITDYEVVRVLSHGGATDGMNTTYMLIPEYEFGIIITTNVFTTFREAVAYTVIDHMLGIEDGNDWNRLFYTNYTSRYETVKRQREEFEAKRIRNTRPSHALRNYTGSWHNDQYDNAEVRLEGSKLVLSLWDDTITGDLEHWHHNTFRIVWHNPAQREEFVKFDMNLEGEIDEMTIRFTLRPSLLQVGAYPTSYYRDVQYQKID